jgi:hypothetical protein
MFQFAAPLGLLALGALLAPILIHLVRRPLQVVKLGSLRFLDSDRQRLRSFRWQQRLLLLLRCALLAALALLLAGLLWQPSAPAPVHWLLRVPGTTLDAAAQAEWNQWRSEGFETHEWNGALTRLSAEAKAPPQSASSFDAWSLLRELDARLPAGSRARIFGAPLANYFLGPRPTLTHLEVTWRPTATAESPTATASPVRPIQALVLAGKNREDDGRYVDAMLRAIGAEVASETPDWIFQLGDAPLAPALLERVKHGARLVVDAPDSAASTNLCTRFFAGGRTLFLHQRTASLPGAPGLLDSRGEPLLTMRSLGQGVTWQFALRFHPDWSDWPITSAFPAWWRDQIRPSVSPPGLIAPEQAAPSRDLTHSPTAPSLPGYGQVDWRLPCWVFAALLFLLERWLSRSSSRSAIAA